MDARKAHPRNHTMKGPQVNQPERFDFEPWDQPVNGDELLSEICFHLNSVVVLPNYGDVAIAGWVVHTYLIEPANSAQIISTSPVLSVYSPDRQCGKSTVKQVLSRLVARPCPTDNIGTASLYRLMELDQPTLLIDEADTFLMSRAEMVGVLNSGYRPDGFVIRQGGLNYTEPMKFATWGAKAICSIGNLPPTLYSRCITIPMKRKRPEESVTRLGAYLRQCSGQLDDLRRKILRFCLDNRDAIALSTPELPDCLDDRQQDNWEPLLQIASVCGEKWFGLMTHAAIAMSPVNIFDETNLAEMLLGDIAEVFDAIAGDRISSTNLLHALLSDETKPWVDYRRGRAMTQYDVAGLLRRYGIRPVDLRVSGKVLKCYLREHFDDAFVRYLGRAATPQRGATSEGESAESPPAKVMPPKDF
jgi:putative DNA primase/helicase